MASNDRSSGSKGPKAPERSETSSKGPKASERSSSTLRPRPEGETELEELKAQIRAQMEEHARKTGYRLNPDPKVVDSLITALAKRAERFGQPYCPCRVATGDPEKDKAIICPCIYHVEEIARQGICHCHLFCSAEYESKHRQGGQEEKR